MTKISNKLKSNQLDALPRLVPISVVDYSHFLREPRPLCWSPTYNPFAIIPHPTLNPPRHVDGFEVVNGGEVREEILQENGSVETRASTSRLRSWR